MSLGGRRPTLPGWVVGAVLMAAGCAPAAEAPSAGAAAAAQARSTTPPAAVADPSPSPAAAVVKRWRSVRQHETTPPPVRVRVPSIGVSSTLQELGRTSDGAIDVPDDWHEAGWYRDGPKPGQAGPAVILGHVDSTTGPAAFYRLRELRAGDEIHVDRVDGSVASFVVDRAERHAKTRFPSHEVYLPTLEPSLRLVTCGGPFDANSRHYRDNVVVFATQVE